MRLFGLKVLSLFPALRASNYQLYFSGQLISLTGTWLQTVAQQGYRGLDKEMANGVI